MLILPVLAAVAAMAAQPPEPSWRDEIQPMEWTLLSRREQIVALGRPATPAVVGEFRRYWQRIEYKQADPKTGITSTVTLAEFDCAQGRSRVLQSQTFKRRNLMEQNTAFTRVGQWEHPIPGTLGETYLQVACAAGSKPAEG